MLREFKLIAFFAALVLLSAGSAMAQGYRDANAKANGNFGTGFSAGGGAARYMQGRSAYFNKPQVVQTVAPTMTIPSAPQVALTPTEVRRFSVEPTQSMAGNCAPVPEERRSFSIEPNARSYRAPVQYNHGSTPTYLLPKSDARKFGG